MITFGLAKKILYKYVGSGGKCPGDDDLDLFVREVLQYLLFNGTHGNERKFVFHAQNGCFTLPKELETPLKVRIDGKVGTVWNRWFEYHSGVDVDDKCLPFDGFLEEPNRYPTVYNLPECGAKVGVMGTCDEDCEAHIIVKGTDPTGREIFTQHKGEKIVGEYLSIKKGIVTTSSVTFGNITEVSKTVTNGYANFVWQSLDGLRRGFLADYDPYEQNPSYRKIRILKKHCLGNVMTVSVLGRIKLKDHYADEDLIPFDNILLLTMAGQAINSSYNSDEQTAISKEARMSNLVEKENNYKRVVNGNVVEVFKPLSGAVIKNVRSIGRHGYGRFR